MSDRQRTERSREGDRRAQLRALPPSAKLIHLVLETDGPATQQQLAEETRLPNRTVRAAIKRLLERDLVWEEIYIPDARKQLYHAIPVRESEAPTD